MEQALEKLRQAPQDRQDQLAGLLLHELEEDERWARSTDVSTDKLKKLVDDILDADRLGHCEPLDPDTL